MKKIIGTLLFAALLTVSCEQQEAQLAPQKKAISFTTESVGTKTTYSGEVQGGKEVIKWQTGDIFSVWCDQAVVGDGSQKKANYKVTASSQGVATAVTPQSADAEMAWGEGLHHFFAAYPSGNLVGNKFNANIPATQQVRESSTNVFSPLLYQYGYMVAATDATQDEGAVLLRFRPIFTTLEFTVSPGPDTDVTVSDFRLEGAEGTTLAGQFQASLSASADPEIAVSLASSAIQLSFDSGGSVTVGKNQTLTFSVIALPVSLSNLTAVFTVNNQEISLPLNDKSGSPITFAAGKKSRIRALGILAPQTEPEPEDTPTDIDVDIDDQDIDDYDLSAGD